MEKEILVNVEFGETRVAVLKDKHLDEFFIEREGQQRLAGNIYKAVVNATVAGIEAAFMDIGTGKDGFLYLFDILGVSSARFGEVVGEDLPGDISSTPKKISNSAKKTITEVLPKGKEILVQVIKEPMGTKGHRLTTHISLPGKYLVFMPYDKQRGISKRIVNEKERVRLKKIIDTLKIPKTMGVIVRTAGEGCTKKQFAKDVNYLLELWHKIKTAESKKYAPALLYAEYDLTLRIVRDHITEDVKKIIVDSKKEYNKITHFLKLISPGFKPKIELYRKTKPLFEEKGLEKEIARIYERKVGLKCRGYIVIEQTEGLIAIDVNSGRYTGKKALEETVFKVNMEAAEEIARQLRLRDIGGIIVIDFIDMENATHRKQVFNTLRDAVKSDKAKTNILSISDIGVVEMTRQRIRKSVLTSSYDTCPYCHGKGVVVSADTVAINTIKKIKKYFNDTKNKVALVSLNKKVASILLDKHSDAILSIENSFRAKIILKQSPDLNVDKVEIKGC